MPQLPGYEIAAVNRPCDEAGGDYYDWQAMGPHRLVFSIGDVAGHGVGPALVTAACRAYVRAVFSNESVPALVLARANQLLYNEIPEGRFVTLVVADLDVDSHKIRLLAAGHGPTIHVAGQSGEARQFDAQGLPLGPFDDPLLDEPIELAMDPGDILVLCTDGFFEPTNNAGEQFGTQRLEELLRANRHRPAAELLATVEAAVEKFTDGKPRPDDMTALAIKRIE